MVHPNQIRTVESDGVSAPDVLRVELRDVDVLDDDVLGSVGNTETLPANHSGSTDSDERLVRSEVDGRRASIVVSHSDGRSTAAPD